MSNNSFTVVEVASFQQKIRKSANTRLYQKIQSFVYLQLRKNPFFGPRIKRLKGKLSAYYRYRMGAYRLFYKIEEGQIIVVIIEIEDGTDAYR